MSKWDDSNGMKLDQGKPRMDLLDPYALTEIAKVLEFGGKKYNDDFQWKKGIQFRRVIASSMRHLMAFSGGEDLDLESGLPHAAHLACCAMFLIWLQKYRPSMDDRYRMDVSNGD
jgi:hypothetical protein